MSKGKRFRSFALACRSLGALAGLGLFTPASAYATVYYVAPTGTDSSPGTMAAPFATLQKGANTALAGDTVYIRGGTYTITTPANSGAGITFSQSGTSDTNRINYFAYPGEVPVFDFASMVISTTASTNGFVVTGSWLHFRGLEIKNVPMNTRPNHGINASSGGNVIFELLNLHHNNGNGIYVDTGTGGDLILNCDAHDNYDPTDSAGDGASADGFGVHRQTSGASTTISGCRAWWNSDDGYDLLNQEVPVIIEGSWAMANGYINSGATRSVTGNGNGFKAGSSATGVRHTIRTSVAWKNAASGFYANHSSGGNDWFNNTSYNNGTQYNMLASPPNDPSTTIVLTGTLVHKMRNNIGFPNKNSNMSGVDTAANSWDLGITPAAGDFVSITDTGSMGPRQADGSLPDIDFMKLPAGSKMIDKGTVVGLPYAGAAPDIGAYEYGATSSGTGGSAGAGGSAGTSGSAGIGGSAGASGSTSTAGNAGIGGTATTAGAAGMSGSTANGGAAGASGTSGQSGTNTVGGTAGVLSSGGAAGASAGSAGSAATAGASGAASGAGGLSGNGGLAGNSVSGANGSGTSGVLGINGEDANLTVDHNPACVCALPGSPSKRAPLGWLPLAIATFGLARRRERS